MSIRERLEREAKRHPGGAGEGIRIALRVLQHECNCGTCAHGRDVSRSNPVSDREEYFECGEGLREPNADDFCSHWEAKS